MKSESPSEFLVISRGQWDKETSKEDIQQAIDGFYLWLNRSIDEGRMKMGSRLGNEGVTVSRDDIATDGPFGEGKEVIGGYWWIIAASLADAAKIAAESPCLKYGIVYELRPLDPELASAYSQAVEWPGESADYKLQLEFPAAAEVLFTALSTQQGAENWWTKFSQVGEGIGGRSSFHFPCAGFHAVMTTLQCKPPRLLEWQCVESKHADDTGYADLHDWVGTRIRFEIRDSGPGRSRLDFTHVGLRKLECLESCRQGWLFFLDVSLRGYLEQGQGQPWDKEAPPGSAG